MRRVPQHCEGFLGCWHPPLYRFRASEDVGGWWNVMWRYGTKRSPWEVVARVFGEKRAEIVRDALSAEANERA